MEDECMEKKCSQMLTNNFKKYWSKFNIILVIEVTLDPSYKL